MGRMMARLLGFLVLSYVALCLAMYFSQRGMIYFPQYTRVAVGETDFALERDGTTLRGWSVNARRHDAVLYFGGNAEDLRGMRTLLGGSLPAHTSYLLAYRGYGASDGVPEESLLLADALALFDEVRSRHPGGRISVIGRSLGSGVASYVASQRPVHRLVLVTPFDSLAAVGQWHYPWLPVDWLARDRYESRRYLAGYTGPVLILRAGRDVVVPPASTDRLIAALPRPPRVVAVPGAGHDDILADPDQMRQISGFLTP